MSSLTNHTTSQDGGTTANYPRKNHLTENEKRQVRIAARDGWHCHYCNRPIVPADAAPGEPFYHLVMRKTDWSEYTWQQKDLADKGLYITWEIFWSVNDPMVYAQIDHKHPRALGGSNHLDNCVLACYRCNQDKLDTPYEEYMARKAVAHD